MSKWSELTPATIFQIVWEIREGKADPEDARRLLELFCSEDGRGTPPELLSHIRDAFRAYLSGTKTLEAALGLARKRGQPGVDEERQSRIAAEVLKHYLTGKSVEESVAAVSEESPTLLKSWGYKTKSLGETQIREAWADHKQNGLILVRLERKFDAYPWTPDEVVRLENVFPPERLHAIRTGEFGE